MTLLPYIGSTGELKTKPTQHSVHELRRLGIQPEMIICRSDFEMPPELREKIALFCDVDEPAVIPLVTFASIYEVPMYLENIGLGNLLVQALRLPDRQPDLAVWEEIVEQVTYSHAPLEIAIVGKYTQLPDAYLSVTESLRHACAANEVSLNLKWVNAEDVEADGPEAHLAGVRGIVVPGGFGPRGIEGKIMAARFARENRDTLSWALPGLAGCRYRIRARRAGRAGQQHRIRSTDAHTGDRPNGKSAGSNEQRRYHAAGRVPVRA